MPTILSIEQTGGRTRSNTTDRGKRPSARGRVQVALDNGDSFILSSLTAARLGLEEGQELSEEAYDEILKSLRKSCMQKCGSLLGTRDYSEQRLREKLQTAGYPADVVEDALQKLRDAGYLDDLRYAESYVRTHIQDRSRLRIMRDLSAKGISEAYIEEAFRSVSEEENIEEAQRRQILRLLQKRGFDPREATFEERQKTMAFLHRKGYPADMIRQMQVKNRVTPYTPEEYADSSGNGTEGLEQG